MVQMAYVVQMARDLVPPVGQREGAPRRTSSPPASAGPISHAGPRGAVIPSQTWIPPKASS